VTVVVAIIAPGAMGAGVGKRLTSHGVRVLTALAGRSEATVARAREAGMAAASDEEIVATDFILSILPPGEALALAQHFAPILTAGNAKPVYVDCNAINPATVASVAAAIAPTGCPFVDAGIIGAPPQFQGRSFNCRALGDAGIGHFQRRCRGRRAFEDPHAAAPDAFLALAREIGQSLFWASHWSPR
jgi:3-hydroxyisobutyrate dehydrogenase-like beta-hydroxyacid dehydrogenase